MNTRRALHRSVRMGAGDARFARECLARVARILVESGYSPQRLWRDLRKICRTLKESRESWDPARLTYIADLTHVITHWHLDDQYVDGRGKPRPLPLRAPQRSLATLIERVMPGRDPVTVVESLLRLKGVRRSKAGLYVPTARHLALSANSARLHCLNTLAGMLRTVEHNVSGKGPYRMFERVVTNPGVPVSALPAFHRRLESRAMNFLVPIDSDLRGREKTKTDEPRVRVGVGAFVFESPVRDRRKKFVDDSGHRSVRRRDAQRRRRR